MHRRFHRGWLRFGGAILLVLSSSACGSFLPPATPGPAGGGAASGDPGIPGVPGIAAASGQPSGAAAAAALAAAMAPLAGAAAFTTTVTVDSTVVATSTGRSVGANLQLTVTSGGSAADYLVVDGNAWARQAGGTWVLVAASQAPRSPLAVLSTPTTLALANPAAGSPSARSPAPSGATSGAPSPATSGAQSGPALAVLEATYPAVALGLTGDAVKVTITIDGSVVTFQYAGESGGHRTTSITALKPGGTTPAIVAPKS